MTTAAGCTYVTDSHEPPANRAKLAGRLAAVAQHALSTRQLVTPLDVLIGIGWLPAAGVGRRGLPPHLRTEDLARPLGVR